MRHAFLLTMAVVLGLPTCGASEDTADLRSERESLAGVLQSADSSLRERSLACERLAVIGDAESVGPLVRWLDDPKLSTYARTALERIPDEAAERALVNALSRVTRDAWDNADPAAIGLLHSIGQRRIASARGLVLDISRDDAMPTSVRSVASRALGRIDGSSDDPSESDRGAQVAVLMRSDSPTDFRSAMTLANRLAKATDSSREGASIAASAIAGQLAKLPPERQSIALIALSNLNDPSVLPEVEKLLLVASDQVFARAVDTIASLGGLTKVDSLPEYVTERPEVATDVMASLARLEKPDFDRDVIAKLRSVAEGDVSLPTAATIGLVEYAASRRLDESTSLLLTLSQSPDAALASTALRAAGSTVTVAQFSDLIAATEEFRQRSPDSDGKEQTIREALQFACVRLPRDQAADAIGVVMEKADSTQRSEMMDLLAFLGGPRALSLVSSAARSGDDLSVDTATRVLGEWLSIDAADELQKLASEISEPKYRLRAIRGLLRLGRQFDMPDRQRIDLIRRGHELAFRSEERRLAIEIAARYPSLEGLRWLISLQNSDVDVDAENSRVLLQTIASVAQRVAKDSPREVDSLLNPIR